MNFNVTSEDRPEENPDNPVKIVLTVPSSVQVNLVYDEVPTGGVDAETGQPILDHVATDIVLWVTDDIARLLGAAVDFAEQARAAQSP